MMEQRLFLSVQFFCPHPAPPPHQGGGRGYSARTRAAFRLLNLYKKTKTKEDKKINKIKSFLLLMDFKKQQVL